MGWGGDDARPTAHSSHTPAPARGPGPAPRHTKGQTGLGVKANRGAGGAKGRGEPQLGDCRAQGGMGWVAPDGGWQEVTLPQDCGGRCRVAPSPCPALQQWGSSNAQQWMGQESPPFGSALPKPPFPRGCECLAGAQDRGGTMSPPHLSPAMTLLGGKTAAWVVPGGQLGCHGDRGVSLLTQWECGGRKGHPWRS